MTPRLAITIAVDHCATRCVSRLAVAPRGTITAVIIGGYVGGVLAAAGGLVLAGVRIGRKIA